MQNTTGKLTNQVYNFTWWNKIIIPIMLFHFEKYDNIPFRNKYIIHPNTTYCILYLGIYLCANAQSTLNSKYVCIGSENCLLPIRRQTITCANADVLSIRPIVTHFDEILYHMQKFPFKRMHQKCYLLNVIHFVQAPYWYEKLKKVVFICFFFYFTNLHWLKFGNG